MKVELDVSESDSCLFIPTSGKMTKIVPANSIAYLGSLAADPDATSFSYGYSTRVQEAEGGEEAEEEEAEEGYE